MSSAPQTERRANVRLLCDERFQNLLLHIQEGDYPVTAINFNRAGIGVFTSKHLPDFTHAELSFTFATEPPLRLQSIPCEAVYSQDTEVGDQYGLRFVDKQIPAATLERLEQIELLAAESNDEQDRYGLFTPQSDEDNT
ncbi:MAG: PilZ domain-containing protein [Oleiphilaceae bacterium]|nr:PilZ domain-containing protein [Oleiphilaceae bacterium]